MHTADADAQPTFRRHWAQPVLLVIMILAAYSNSLRGPFILDDISSLRNNPEVNSQLPSADPEEQTTLSGRPVLAWTFQINNAVGGMDVVGYHVVNVLIHAGCALLLYGIIRRNLSNEVFWGKRFRDDAAWLAFAVAAMWAVHPLNTEAVTYIVQRAESLAGLFYLAVIYCLIRTAASRKGAIWWGVMAIAACAAGMGTKEIVVTAPFMALIYDRTFLAGTFSGALRRGLYVGLATPLIALGLVSMGGWRSQSVGFSFHISALDYFRTQLGVIARYLCLSIWPRHLVLDYYDWPIARHWSQIGWGGGLVLLLLALTIFALWKKPWLGFLGAWFFIILAPSSSFLPVATEVAAEHRMYLSLIAVIALPVIGFWRLCDCSAIGRMLVAAVFCLVLIGLSIRTFARNEDYLNPLVLWQKTVQQRPRNPRAHYNLGYTLAVAGRRPEAAAEYRQAMQLEPDYFAAARSLIALEPLDADAHFRLGIMLENAGDWRDARYEFLTSLRIDPNFVPAQNALTNLVQRESKTE